MESTDTRYATLYVLDKFDQNLVFMTISILASKGKLNGKSKNLTVAFLFLSGIDCAVDKLNYK